MRGGERNKDILRVIGGSQKERREEKRREEKRGLKESREEQV